MQIEPKVVNSNNPRRPRALVHPRARPPVKTVPPRTGETSRSGPGLAPRVAPVWRSPRALLHPRTRQPIRLDGAIIHTGPRPATSQLSLPIAYLLATLSASATFQAWVGAANAGAALNSIFTPSAPPGTPLPYAIVDHYRAFRREKIAGGTRNYFYGRGGLSLWFRSAIPSGANDQDAAVFFENQVGNVMGDVEVLSGQAAYLDIERVELVDGPYRPEEDEAKALGDFYEILLRVEYRSL